MSTGRADLASAEYAGLEIQQHVLAQLAAGESISKKTFGAVAAEELAAMQRALDNHRAPTTFRDYIFAINKYLIPFFGRLPFASIRDERKPKNDKKTVKIRIFIYRKIGA